LESTQDLTLAWHLGKGEAPTGPVDVAIAASSAEAVEGHLAWALDQGTDLVIGATGWQIPDLGTRIENRIGVLVAPNFSLGVALMTRLSLVLGRFAATDAELDPSIFEHHHRAKADAPSGTALRLARAVMEGCPRKSAWTMGPAAPHELSVAVLRAGSEFGLHTVGLHGPAETLALTHQARSRAVFARGALRAARWIHGRKGLHTFDELAQELLDPLFAPGGTQ
jgi:4-hydroxy-tetrahydrodipicolinate reductase